MAEYRLLDFGDGRKLEAIGDLVIDRPCPAADGVSKREPRRWRDADSVVLRGVAGEGWRHRRAWPESLAVDCGNFKMPIEATPFGHLGLFPEQRPNWEWIRSFAGRWSKAANSRRAARPFRVLNLLGYTGATTLAAASSFDLLPCEPLVDVGAEPSADVLAVDFEPLIEVVHVDAAKPNVEAAKRAASVNGLGSIRFLVDDARKFVAREIRRQRCYDLVILDPPAYGHGAKGQGGKGATWRLERDLWPLLEGCLKLLRRGTQSGRLEASGYCGLLLTGHTESCGPAEIRRWLRSQTEIPGKIESGRAGLEDEGGRFLDAGFYFRVEWG